MARRVVLTFLFAVLLAGCGGQGSNSTPSVVIVKSHRPDLSPTVLPPPTLSPPAALRTELAYQMMLAGSASGAYVYDITKHQVLFRIRANVARAPASVEKLYTSTVALAEMGANARLRTSILGVGHLGAHGEWVGNLYLRGGGDPTFGSAAFNAVWTQGEGATDAVLAGRLMRVAGIRSVSGHLIADSTLFDAERGGPTTNGRADILDLGGELGALTYNHGATMTAGPKPKSLTPGAYAAAEVAKTLRRDGVNVRASTREAATPTGARLLASVASPPLSQILTLMNLPSDDFYAELLLKQLGARFAGVGSTAAGASVVKKVLRGIGVTPQIVDGSGLSRSDQTTPAEVVRVLTNIANTPVGTVLRASLPVPGVSGTLARRLRGTVASQRCNGKTGSLIGVFNVAGYCNGANGDLLAYAIFMDGPDVTTQRQEQDSMILALAKY